MAAVISDAEIMHVQRLEGAKRYEYAVKRIADRGLLWSLRNDGGWVLAGDDSGRIVVPIWPFKEFSQLCATGGWSDCVPQSIETKEWLARWTPGIERDGRWVGVFPSQTERGVVVGAREFADALMEQIALIE